MKYKSYSFPWKDILIHKWYALAVTENRRGEICGIPIGADPESSNFVPDQILPFTLYLQSKRKNVESYRCRKSKVNAPWASTPISVPYLCSLLQGRDQNIIGVQCLWRQEKVHVLEFYKHLCPGHGPSYEIVHEVPYVALLCFYSVYSTSDHLCSHWHYVTRRLSLVEKLCKHAPLSKFP